MLTAVQSVYGKFIDFNGRATRAEYWWFFLFTFLVGIVLIAAVPAIYLAFALINLLPTFAVFVRRLHDTDHSGWWWLVGLIPLVGGFILLYFLIISGTQGPNRFGPQPAA